MALCHRYIASLKRGSIRLYLCRHQYTPGYNCQPALPRLLYSLNPFEHFEAVIVPSNAEVIYEPYMRQLVDRFIDAGKASQDVSHPQAMFVYKDD